MSETKPVQELRTVQVVRTVNQIATVNMLVSKDKSTDEVSDQLIEMTKEGQIDHLWRDVEIVGIDAHDEELNASVSEPGTVPSILFSQECAKSKACVRAMRIEHLRNVHNVQMDASSCDEAEGTRDYVEMASMLADMMHWCQFFNVDFKAVRTLASTHFKQERDEA